jgi:hypothetical protein
MTGEPRLGRQVTLEIQQAALFVAQFMLLFPQLMLLESTVAAGDNPGLAANEHSSGASPLA